jgi:hypothetical protein
MEKYVVDKRLATVNLGDNVSWSIYQTTNLLANIIRQLNLLLYH